MDMQNLEQSHNSIQRLSQAIDELIAIIGRQKQEFHNILNNEKNNAAAKDSRIAALETHLNTLKNDYEKMHIELIAVQNNKESEVKIQELQQEIKERSNKINGLQIEIQNLNSALNNRKAQIEELHTQNRELQEKLSIADNKIAEYQNIDNTANEAMQNQIADLQQTNESLNNQNKSYEQKIEELQQIITQTSGNIDNVVAKLEKVLEENGASNNNN